MRAVGSIVVRRFAPLVSSGYPLAASLGAACGVAGVVVLTQIVATLGVSFGVRIGLGIGTLVGIAWGLRGLKGRRPVSAAGQVLSLAAVILVWPTWIALQLDLAQGLPESFWRWSWGAEVSGMVFGLLSWSVPVAAGTQLLMVAAVRRRTEGEAPFLAVVCGMVLGIGVLACGLAPLWGVYWPALIILAVASLALFGAEWPGERVAWPQSAGVTSTSELSWQGIGLTLLAGLQIHAGCGFVSEIAPATLPLWQATLALLMLGWGVGSWFRAVQRSTGATPDTQTLSLVLAATGLLLLLTTAGLIDLNLWMSSRIVTPVVLEVSRLLLIAFLVGPTAIWCGFVAPGFGAVGSGTRTSILLLLGGVVAGELGLLVIPDPLTRLWIIATAVCLSCVAELVRRQSSRRTQALGATASLFAALALFAVTIPMNWPAGRAVQLLFSTPALLAARSDWPTELLPQLDDIHLIGEAGGAEGRWTLWKTRGAELHVRCQGVPRGAITSRPAWSPQYAPEIASTVWPLILVDQPARVLVLGAGSSASLQAALAFPLSEVVCCEADDALMQLIRSNIAAQGGFDPFADDRCQRIRQPHHWLALPQSTQFDVIVSDPPTAITPAAAASMNAEFYQRAAQRLSPQGVFCQRFSSVDFGPRPLLTAAASLRTAFAEIACLEVSAGEFLLLGAHDPAVLVREDLPRRLELPHVVHILSRCNWDWSMPLNLPAYDRAALAEAADEVRAKPQTAADPWLSYFTPRELMRWAPKLQETANLLTKVRTSPAVYPLPDVGAPPQALSEKTSRKGRYLEWIGPQAEDPAVLRRLAEAASLWQLVYSYPDAHWWEYRKELREQLQDHPRSAIHKVNFTASGDPSRWHPEDRRRKSYFETLGAALKAEPPTPQQLQDLEQLLEPFDPLLTLFAHQELAELYARGNVNPLVESQHRLHVIYYAPIGDASVRNVVAEIDHLVAHADAAASDADRFEQLNGLLQTLRGRWEARNGRPTKSARVTQQEIEHSLVSVERALETMQPLAASAGWSEEDWQHRCTVLERILIRPFRSYRDQLAQHARESERKTRELLRQSTAGDSGVAKPQ
ncbi:MAG: hypothetical protein SFV23_20565 [Planctomycetaceae bacterium]|nr:hypothetical protein [Planctomycetaceae bacterium]